MSAKQGSTPCFQFQGPSDQRELTMEPKRKKGNLKRWTQKKGGGAKQESDHFCHSWEKKTRLSKARMGQHKEHHNATHSPLRGRRIISVWFQMWGYHRKAVGCPDNFFLTMWQLAQCWIGFSEIFSGLWQYWSWILLEWLSELETGATMWWFHSCLQNYLK